MCKNNRCMVDKIGHFPNFSDETGHIPGCFLAQIGHAADSPVQPSFTCKKRKGMKVYQKEGQTLGAE